MTTNKGREEMKKLAILAVIALACMAMAQKPKEPKPAPPSQVEVNKKLVSDMFQMLFVDHKVDEAIDTYFDPGYIQHNPSAPDGAETIRKLFKGWFAAVPTARSDVQSIGCEGDLCVVFSHGTQKPGDRGTAVVDWFRIANGKIAEHWDVVEPVPEKSANTNTMF
jgi:predicted SnoaL-like aldol condensation-catalyzing enzyme